MATDRPGGQDLHGVLAELAMQAAELAAQPLRPSSENLSGYIETIWAERPGTLWLTGWITRDAGQEFAAVLVDRAKYPAALALACYERADLPGNAHAFIALLQTDWQPGPDSTDVFLFVGPDLRRFIRSVNPLRLQEGRAFAEEFARVQTLCHAGRVAELRASILGGENWVPDTAAVSGATVRAATDEILVLPGFGCFLQGWLLSPTKRLVRLSLRLGDRVLNGLPGSLYFLPRPDLAGVLPQPGPLLERAGHVSVLAGPLGAEDMVSPILKAWFSDGTSVNLPVDPMVMRRLGHGAAHEALLRLYPGIAEEAFFPACALAIRRDMAARLGEVLPLRRIGPAERCLAVALPGQASDARLMVEEVARHLRGVQPAPAVALLADHGETRARLPLLAEVIARATGTPAATFLVEDATKPLFALGPLLEAVGARRFLLLMAGAVAGTAAWTEALATLMGEDPGLAVIAAEEGRKLAGMAWTTAAFLEHAAAAGFAVGTTHGDSLLGLAGRVAGPARLASVAARHDRLLEQVDRLPRGRGRDQ